MRKGGVYYIKGVFRKWEFIRSCTVFHFKCFFVRLFVCFFFSLSYDYLKITDENSNQIGKYCGTQFSGREVFVGGKKALLTFHSDSYLQRRGFLLKFNTIPPSKYV